MTISAARWKSVNGDPFVLGWGEATVRPTDVLSLAPHIGLQSPGFR